MSILDRVKNAEDLFKSSRNNKLSTGCVSIDTCLKGGIIKNSISEISGEASSGKTQLALQLAIYTILPESQGGCNGNALFINTESKFPVGRLYEMTNEFCRLHRGYTPDIVSNNILIEEIHTVEAFINYINTIDKKLSANRDKNVKVVLIDSIANLFRGEGSADSYLKRAEQLRKLYTRMNDLCLEYDLTFLIVNQVTASFNEPIENYSDYAGSALLPSLGNTVTQYTHHRYMLCRRGMSYPAISIRTNAEYEWIHAENTTNTPTNMIRDFYIIFSPELGNRKTSFTITKAGVVSL